MNMIEDHPILERVFEQRVKEAIIEWVIMTIFSDARINGIS